MAELVDSWTPLLRGIEEKLAGGSETGFDEALRLTEIPERRVGELVRLAQRMRRRFAGDQADLCSIINARSGICPEDCRFCTQSSHYQTGAPVYPMKPPADILESAMRAEAAGAHRFCVVTSGDTLSDRDFESVLDALALIGRETGLRRCASTGFLDRKRALLLKQAGLHRYHHNVETARSYFPQVCSTHTYDDKVETIRNLKDAGIETCVGGILNMGESPRQRVEFAFELKELGPDSVPVNFLVPRAGTPLGSRSPMPAPEAAVYLAIFRLVMPRTSLRLAGGRLETFGDKAAFPFDAGVNALLIGDLLTTAGPDPGADVALMNCLGFDLGGRD